MILPLFRRVHLEMPFKNHIKSNNVFNKEEAIHNAEFYKTQKLDLLYKVQYERDE